MRKAVIGLFVLNAIILALVVWLISERTPQTPEVSTADSAELVEDAGVEILEVDTVIKKLPDNARIAYFFMDSVSAAYKLVEEHQATFASEENRLEGKVKRAATRANQKQQELMAIDPTYKTQAELEQLQREAENLWPGVEKVRVDAEKELARLTMSMQYEITSNIAEFLADYNEVQGLDFIYSIQESGQIWVGNEGLNISQDVIRGLNLRHRKNKNNPVKVDSVQVAP